MQPPRASSDSPEAGDPESNSLLAAFVEALRPWESRFGDGVLIAVSGGSDSTALARLFQLARDASPPSIALPPLWLGHVHHGLRADADEDAEFVSSLASTLGMRFLVAKIDAGSTRSSSISHETIARELRYEQFWRWTSDHHLGIVATAHTADDQDETLLLNLARGCGLRGLAGMPPSRPLRSESPAGPVLTRPLLGRRCVELKRVLRQLDQPFRVDETNNDVGIPRNAVRHLVLPALVERVHPGTHEALARMSARSRDLLNELESWSRLREAELRIAGDRSDDQRRYHAAAFLELPPMIQELVLRRGIDELAAVNGVPPASLSSRHIAELERRLSWSTQNGSGSVHLQRGWQIEIDGDVLRLLAPSDRSDSLEAIVPESHCCADDVRLGIPGRADWRGWEIRADAVTQRPPVVPSDPYSEVVDLGALGPDLVVRQRRAGDVFQPLGSSGRQKLKEFLRASGVPRPQRDSVPLVADQGVLVWVVGKRLSEVARVRSTTKRWGLLRATPPREGNGEEE